MNLSNLTILDAVTYIDSIMAMEFEQIYKMPDKLNASLLANITDLFYDYFKYTLAGNETSVKFYLTGIFKELMRNVNGVI